MRSIAILAAVGVLVTACNPYHTTTAVPRGHNQPYEYEGAPMDPGPVDPGPAPVDPGPVDPGPGPVAPGPGPVDPGPGPVDPGPGAGPVAPPSGAPGWSSQTATVTGYGAPREGAPPGQARLLAMRAARLDAMRKLSEQIQGLELTSSTKVKDFVTEHDEIRTRTQAMVRDAQETSSRINPDGTAEVTLSLPLNQVYELVRPYMKP